MESKIRNELNLGERIEEAPNNCQTVKLFLSSCCGIRLTTREINDPHICFQFLVEDDGFWFENNGSISTVWLKEIGELWNSVMFFLNNDKNIIQNSLGGWEIKQTVNEDPNKHPDNDSMTEPDPLVPDCANCSHGQKTDFRPRHPPCDSCSPDNNYASYHKKKLPTLPDYIKEHGWPDGMNFASVFENGSAFYSNMKLNGVERRFGQVYKKMPSVRTIGEGFDATNWQNSLVEKCDECNGKGIVNGSTDQGNTFKIYDCPTCNGTKIKPEPKVLGTLQLVDGGYDKPRIIEDDDFENNPKQENKNPCKDVNVGLVDRIIDSPDKCPNYAHCNDCAFAKKTCTTNAEAVVNYHMKQAQKRYDAGDPKEIERVNQLLRMAKKDFGLVDKPKLKSLADEPWPDPNEGQLWRIPNYGSDGSAYYTAAENPFEHPIWKKYKTLEKVEKHPRYDDILWLKKWQGKNVTFSDLVDEWYEVVKLTTYGKFIGKYKGQQEKIVNIGNYDWWFEYKEKQ